MQMLLMGNNQLPVNACMVMCYLQKVNAALQTFQLKHNVLTGCFLFQKQSAVGIKYFYQGFIIIRGFVKINIQRSIGWVWINLYCIICKYILNSKNSYIISL